ncbi:hypothetical protein AaE_016054 [Aphanomyces astaci]|uniref:DDE-1 domain-containing protein n=1 Tax=Aphanomyces astaci TaxID=112090 RepID=A0A6A4Z598_APHAT|nr:hypothetical protein AaE_016054 [Aphanomyces astaci]
MEAVRARRSTGDVVEALYANLPKVLADNHFDPDCIWNLDESGTCAQTVAQQDECVGVQANGGNAQKADSRQNVYVLVCVNAGGGHVAPFFILPGSNVCKRMTQCGLPGSNFAATKSSFLLFIQFFEWFVKKIGPKRPVLVFMDTRLIGPPGRLSMLGPRASTFAVFAQFKRLLDVELANFQLVHSRFATTSDMVGLASNGLTRTYIVSGFEKAGISLLSRDIMMAKIVGDKAGLKATAVIQATVRPENRVVVHLRELGIDIDSAHVFCINDAMVQAFTNRASTPKGDMTGFMVACS